MFYDFAFTVPANTLEATLVSQELKLTAGVIQQVKLLFPPGPHGMVKVKIMDGIHQVLPTNPDGYFATDDEVLNIDEHLEVDPSHNSLTAVGYSPGTTYDHTISIRIGILRPEDVEKTSMLASGLKKLLALMGIRV